MSKFDSSHKHMFATSEIMQTSWPLSDEQMADWSAHVLDVFPNEACAFIVDGKIHPVKNVSENPTEQFAVDTVERFEIAGEISGFLHSHPVSPQEAGKRAYSIDWPSTLDMKTWMTDDIRWGISGTDGENVTAPIWLDDDYIAPLEGRNFIHGIHDCWAVIRDYYRTVKQVDLMNFARGMDWWYEGGNLYEENFGKAGFVEIAAKDVQEGDLILMALGGSVISHGAVFIDSNTMLHHNFSRSGTGVSCYTRVNHWSKHFAKFIRYSPKP